MTGPGAQSRAVCLLPKPTLAADPGHQAQGPLELSSRSGLPLRPPALLTTPIVHEDHPKNVLRGLGNGDRLSKFVPRTHKESLPWGKAN